MNEFFSWEYMATYGGMTVFVTTVTQVLKHYVNISPKWVALASAVIGQAAVQVLHLKDLSASGIAMSVFNALCVLLGAVGAYETVVKPMENSKDGDGDA